jgi:hypothetical protein
MNASKRLRSMPTTELHHFFVTPGVASAQLYPDLQFLLVPRAS